jgi:hypothetical protein
MGLGLPTFQDFSASTWILKFQDYEDEMCTVPMESSWTASFRKNECYQEGDLYVSLNIIAEPLRAFLKVETPSFSIITSLIVNQ